jgi:predicted Zn-dependent protease
LLCYFKIKGSRPAAELARVERKLKKVAAVAPWLNTWLIILRSNVQVQPLPNVAAMLAMVAEWQNTFPINIRSRV